MVKLFSFVFIFVLFVQCAHHQGRPTPGHLKNLSDKGNSYYYYLVSKLESYEGDDDSSLFYLDKSIRQNPSSLYLMTEKAYQYARQNKLDKALKLAKKTYAKDKNDYHVNILMGKIHTALNKPAEAMRYYQKAVEIDPEAEEVYSLMAREYMVMEETDNAVVALKKILDLNPESIAAYFYLARIYIDKKDYRRALEMYDTILAIEPDEPRVLSQTVEIYLAQKDYKKALVALNRIKDINPDDLRVWIRTGLLYYELKDIPNAIRILEEIIVRYPESDRLHYYLGLLYQESRNDDLAIGHYEAIPFSSQFYEDAIIRQVYLLSQQNKISKALRAASRALAAKPMTAAFYDLVASLNVLEEDYNRAIAILKKGLKEIPDNEQILFSLGTFYEKKGDIDASLTIMHRLLEINPNHHLALNFIGYSYAEKGTRLDYAQELIEKALSLKPNDGFIVDSLGWVLYKKGRLDEAEALLEKADRLVPNEPAIMEHLGEVYLRKKNKRKARRHLEQSLFELNKKIKKSPQEMKQIDRIRRMMGEL